MTDAIPPSRASLFPEGIERVQLYHRSRFLLDDIARCRAAGWSVIEFHTEGWVDSATMHDDLAEGLGLPPYYGRNLDALNDVLGEVSAGRFGFPADAAGGALVLHRFEGLVGAKPGLAEALVDVVSIATVRAVEHGWPLAVMIQSNDPDLSPLHTAPTAIGWNRSERRRSDRSG